jgi:hypothetical protein
MYLCGPPNGRIARASPTDETRISDASLGIFTIPIQIICTLVLFTLNMNILKSMATLGLTGASPVVSAGRDFRPSNCCPNGCLALGVSTRNNRDILMTEVIECLIGR